MSAFLMLVTAAEYEFCPVRYTIESAELQKAVEHYF
jgi:hypothetical protein